MKRDAAPLLQTIQTATDGELPRSTHDLPKPWTGKRVCVIHGVRATPQAHWFPWLRNQLAAEGSDTPVLQMPQPDCPDPAAWIAFLRAQFPAPDADTFFVAHSLGCIAVLRYLETLAAPTRIGGFVLVAGFSTPLPALPQLDAFTRGHRLGAERIIALAPHRSVIASRDDGVVPHHQVEALGLQLRAGFHTIEAGGHFCSRDGFTTLPIVYDHLNAMIGAGR